MWVLQCLAIFVSTAFGKFDEEYDLEPQDMVMVRNGGYPTASPIGTSTRFQMTASLHYKVVATCYVNITVSFMQLIIVLADASQLTNH